MPVQSAENPQGDVSSPTSIHRSRCLPAFILKFIHCFTCFPAGAHLPIFCPSHPVRLIGLIFSRVTTINGIFQYSCLSRFRVPVLQQTSTLHTTHLTSNVHSFSARHPRQPRINEQKLLSCILSLFVYFHITVSLAIVSGTLHRNSLVQGYVLSFQSRTWLLNTT